MKATIIGKPHFEVEVTQGMVEGLLELSQAHYDGTCKTAGRPGGLLWGWKNQAAWSRESGDPLVVSGSFRELDLTLKICECLTVIGGRLYYKEIQQYRSFVASLLRRSNELSHWKEEFAQVP